MDGLRIVSLGGFNQVTSNLYVYHFLPDGKEENDQLLIVDCGFGFPEESSFGVDLVIPDNSYLEKRKKKIVGIVLTHGHEDHIGALPFILPSLPETVPLFGTRLTAAMVREKLAEGGIARKITVFDFDQRLNLGRFLITPIRVTHSLPDTAHFFIQTPVGNFYHGSDFKFDLTPPDGKKSELDKIVDLGRKGVLALLSDCLGSEKRGYSSSELTLGRTFEEEIGRAKGRVFVTAISSNIYRWQSAINASRRFRRKIALVGFSIEKNIRIARKLGYIDLKKGELISYQKALKLPDNGITFLIAGSLGQVDSSLESVVLGKHKISVKPGDKVIFSSPDYIPRTTGPINRLINSLITQGVKVVYHDLERSIHVSGHASRQELALLINLLSPKYLIPIGGEERHAYQYSKLAQKMGYLDNQIIIPQKGAMPTFWSNGRMDLNFRHKARRVLIDGLGVGDVGKTVLRDRRILAKEGMIVPILLIDSQTKQLAEKPTVISRGFVYLKENKKLLSEIEKKAEEIYTKTVSPIFSLNSIRYQIQGEIENFVKKKTGREPMVLPVVLEI